jgi:KDO2-lipid IV(A) lauroyltransferase
MTTPVRAGQTSRPLPWITAKNVLLFLYLYVGRWLSRLPPRLFDLLRPIADGAFQILSLRRTDAIVDELAVAFPETPRPTLLAVRRKFASAAVRRALDDLVLAHGREKPNCTAFIGREHLDEAIAGGKGVLLAGLHWQAGRVARRHLKNSGYPVLSIRMELLPRLVTGRLAHDTLVSRYADFFRGLHDDEVFTDDPERSLKMLARLRSNGIVTVLMDAVRAEHGMELPFLGRTRRFPAGIFYLARAAGCPILPIFSRGGMQSLEIEIGAPLPLDYSLPAEQFWRVHLPALVAVLETQVRAHPEEWSWTRL